MSSKFQEDDKKLCQENVTDSKFARQSSHKIIAIIPKMTIVGLSTSHLKIKHLYLVKSNIYLVPIYTYVHIHSFIRKEDMIGVYIFKLGISFP